MCLITYSGEGISLDDIEAYGLSLMIDGVADELGLIQNDIEFMQKEGRKAA